MSYRFLVFINERGEDELCEGGVYTDDVTLLQSEEIYRENDFAGLEEMVSRLNGMSSSDQYAARDHFECRLDKFDIDVLSSLNTWQKNALKVSYVIGES
jgi:hypothetical protein